MSDSVCTEFLQENSIHFTNIMPIEPSKVKLLDYYTSKISSHQKEREEWLSQLEHVGHSQEHLYALLDNLRLANDKIYQLQARMSTIQNSIFSEKHQALMLLQENKELKLQELADKKRLQEFISITAPKQKSETFFEDKRPSSSKSLKGSKECSWCAICKQYNGPRHNHNLGKTTTVPKTIIRTVYLPNEELNSLVMETEMIKDQIEQEREAFESELQAIKDEQSIREQEKNMRLEADQARINELTDILFNEEQDKALATKEYLRLRYELQESEKNLFRTNQEMENKLNIVRDHYKNSRNLAKIETKEEERQADKKTNEFSYKFRKEVIKYEDNVQICKEEYSELQEKYAQKIDELEKNISDLTQSYKDLEEKRRISKNKLNTQVDKLQDKLRQLETENRAKNNLKVSKNKKNND